MVTNTVKLPKLDTFAFPEPPADGVAHVIGIINGQLITKHVVVPVNELGTRDIARLAVIERHGKNGNMAYALVADSGLKRGAFATTIAHDSHNLLVLGQNDADMKFAAETLASIGGGAVAVLDNQVLASMPFPIGGLMSDQRAEVVIAQNNALNKAARELGITWEHPLTTLSFLALPVIPELKLTDRGLFDTNAFRFTELYTAE